MKRFLLPAVVALAALSLFTTPAQAQSTSSSSTSSATPAPGLGGRHRGQANSPERHAREIIAKFDKDGDHMLNATELAAFFESAHERAEARRSQSGATGSTTASTTSATPAPKAKGGLGGHGNPQEHAAKAIEKFDKNHDGKLDAGELTAMLIALRERAMERHGATAGQNQPASQTPGQTHTAPATTIPTNPGS